MPIAAQRQFVIKVSGIDGNFSTRTGAETTADVTREYDGGSLTPEVLTGPAMTGDLTVGRPFNPERDADVLRELRPRVGRERRTITVSSTDADLVVIGSPTVYEGLLIGVNDPEANAGSGDAARVELTFAVTRVS